MILFPNDPVEIILLRLAMYLNLTDYEAAKKIAEGNQ